MEEKRKIRMPIGAAVACLLIVALLTVGIVAGAKFINNSLSASQTEKNASAQATSAPSGSNGTVGSSGDKTGDLPSDKLSYAGSSARPDSEYKTIENCMSSVVSIDVTAQSGHKSVLAGSGSGVIISADGYIVTCNHVVEGAQKIFVYLDNGNDYEATLVGTDSVTDLAVIKINAYNLSYAKFGDSSTLSVGEDVFAIGNALGQLSNTYTRGSISGLDRSITIDNVTMTLLQTDAAINQGNSGGGLFRESDGTLIGIVNAKSSGSGIEGLGFAIPSTLAREVIGSLMDYGFVVGRPYLGVSTQDVSLSRKNDVSDIQKRPSRPAFFRIDIYRNDRCAGFCGNKRRALFKFIHAVRCRTPALRKYSECFAVTQELQRLPNGFHVRCFSIYRKNEE